MKKILMGIFALTLLVSCNMHDNEDSNVANRWTSIATVQNSGLRSDFYFRLDNNDLMWVRSTNFPNYVPKDGQRIIADYNILSVNNESALYNHKVALVDVYEVLTKGIFAITPATQDSIGNNPIEVRQMWIGSDYLNVEFNYYGYNKIHFISLVKDAAKTYTDNKVHLEFRHNANADATSYSRWGVVSFKLSTLKQSAVGDSVNLVIHTKEFGSAADRSYNLTYKFGALATQQQVRKMVMPSKEFVVE